MHTDRPKFFTFFTMDFGRGILKIHIATKFVSTEFMPQRLHCSSMTSPALTLTPVMRLLRVPLKVV